MDLTIAKKVIEISVLDFLLVQIVRQPFLVYGPNLFIGLFLFSHSWTSSRLNGLQLLSGKPVPVKQG